MLHRSIGILIGQILILFVAVKPIGQPAYIYQQPMYKINNLTMLSINLLAMILELLFFNNTNVCKAILFVSIFVAGIVSCIIGSIAKQKYYELLKQRIQIVQKDSPTKNFKEMQAVLVEKFDKLYSISDIQKVYTDF